MTTFTIGFRLITIYRNGDVIDSVEYNNVDGLLDAQTDARRFEDDWEFGESWILEVYTHDSWKQIDANWKN